jgi:hypothetical protein
MRATAAALFGILIFPAAAAAQELPKLQCTATQGYICEQGQCQQRPLGIEVNLTVGGKTLRLCSRKGSEELCANLDAVDILTYPATSTATARLVHRDGVRLLGNATYMIDVGTSQGFVVTGLRGGSVQITAGTCKPAG